MRSVPRRPSESSTAATRSTEPRARWSGWRPTLVVTIMRSRVPREVIHSPMIVSLRPAAKLSAVSTIAPPVPAYRSSTENAASVSTVHPNVEAPSASGCADSPVSPIARPSWNRDRARERVRRDRLDAHVLRCRSRWARRLRRACPASPPGRAARTSPPRRSPRATAYCVVEPLCSSSPGLDIEDMRSAAASRTEPPNLVELLPNRFDGPHVPRARSRKAATGCRGCVTSRGARAPRPGAAPERRPSRRGTRTRRPRSPPPRARRGPTRDVRDRGGTPRGRPRPATDGCTRSRRTRAPRHRRPPRASRRGRAMSRCTASIAAMPFAAAARRTWDLACLATSR